MGLGVVRMDEKERQCILCGKREPMLNYICTVCQDRIQREVIKKNSEGKAELLRVVKEHGDKRGNSSES